MCLNKLLTVSQDYAINNKLTPFISMQNQYSLLYREEEREMFPTLKASIDTLNGMTWLLTSTKHIDVWRRCDSVVAALPRSPHSPAEDRHSAQQDGRVRLSRAPY